MQEKLQPTNSKRYRIMKKLFMMGIVAMSLLVASCSGNKSDGVPMESGIIEPIETLLATLEEKVKSGDSDGIQAALEAIQAACSHLSAEEAADYVAKTKQWLADNADAVEAVAGDNTTAKSLVEQMKELPGGAEEAVSEAIDDAATKAQEKASEAVESAKSKASDAIDDAASKLLKN